MYTSIFSLLLSGIALAAVAARLVSMQGDLEKAASDKRRMRVEQVNKSAAALVKSLLSENKGNPPAIYPEPYLRPVSGPGASPPAELSTRISSSVQSSDVWGLDQTGESWGIVLAAGSAGLDGSSRFSSLKFRIPDSSRIDPVTFYSNAAGTGAGSLPFNEVTVRMLGLTMATGGIAGAMARPESADFSLSVPAPGNSGIAGKSVELKVRVEIPAPPNPTCQLVQPSPTTVALLVSGVATSASITDSAGNQLGSPVTPNPAVSVFGRDKVFITATTNLPLGTLRGSAEGPGGTVTCGGVAAPVPTPTSAPLLASACDPAGIIDFEERTDHNIGIDNQYKSTHGVTFQVCDHRNRNSAPVCNPMMLSTKDKLPRRFTCNGGSLCSSINNGTYKNSAAIMGKKFIAGTLRKGVILEVTYDRPVSEASGYLMDLDAGEFFIIRAKDANGNIITENVNLDARRKPCPKEPAFCGANNILIPGDDHLWKDGQAMMWEVKSSQQNIVKIEFHGQSTDQLDNVAHIAFDRFSPAAVCN